MKNLILRRLTLVLLLSATVAHGAWQPAEDDSRQTAVAATIAAFRNERPELQEYFDNAYAFAVFPTVVKAASAFGVGGGKGLVITAGKLRARCSQLFVDLGPQVGVDTYSQIIFFRDPEALDTFAAGRLEFRGRAAAVALTAGAHADGAYLPSVAVFSRTKLGLSLQLAAGVTKFGYREVGQPNEAVR